MDGKTHCMLSFAKAVVDLAIKGYADGCTWFPPSFEWEWCKTVILKEQNGLAAV